MWYWIIALIFFALEIAFVAVVWRAYDVKNELTTDLDDVLENLPIVLGLTAIGALVWPLIVAIISLIILFNLFLKNTFNKIVNWLAEHL